MKTWEKILLYPVGLYFWLGDRAKKAGKFMGRKVKPAVAMLLAVTMLLSVMPLTSITAFAAGTDTGKAIQLVNSGTAANIGGGQADSIYFGTYKQSSDGNSGYNVDPIKWRVLSNADGKLFLLSDQNLDVFEYHKEKESVTWETSTMRSWLNGLAANQGNGDDAIDYTSNNFLDTAFSAKEQAAIADTTVVNDDNGSVDGGNDTTDKVFLLSIAEAENTSYFADDNSRIATNTAYVVGGGEIGTIGMNSVGEADYWWLRSPGCHDYCAARVNSGGVYSYGFVDKDIHAVRPAFNLNLNSVLFTSAADNSGHISRFGTALPDYSGSEWKLTLKDGNDFSTDAAINATKTYAGGKLEITHKALSSFVNAAYTDVTAMLQDAEGKILYYGSIDTNVTATKTILTIPTDIAVGDYVLSVYAEDWNGAYATDYATLIPFTTTISIRHIHPVCGKTHTDIGDHTGTCADIEWTAVQNENELINALQTGGNYYLANDVTLTTSSNHVNSDVTINLCLNGHSINAAGGYFDVSSNGTLNLCSCKDNGVFRRTSTTEALIFADNGATVNLYNITLDGGAVWGGTTDTTLLRGTANSGIVSSSPLIDAGYQRTAGGHITLNSGVVLQNNECSDAGDGGAVTIGEDGTLVINGATIRNNAKTSGNAGAIKAYAGAKITLNSGEIYGNEAYKHGGAVQIFGGDSTDYATAVFTMNGGTIRNNKADGVGGAIAVSDYSKFVMSGGSIADNATTDYSKRGGGVGFADANTEMAISGNAVITDNAANSTANNLYIGTNSCNTVTVGEMKNGANIGVTMRSSSGGVFTNGGADYVDKEYFTSDKPAYIVAADGNNLKLTIPHTHSYTYAVNGENAAQVIESCTCGHTGTATISATDATYDGLEHNTATVDYSEGWKGGELTISYANNTNAGTATASITIEGKTASVKFTIEKATPTAEDFIFTAPTDLIYDGTAKPATITVKDGIVGMGEVNVIYFRDAGVWIDNEREPIYPGRYKVGIWIKEGDNYKAVYSDERIWLGSDFEIKYLTTDAKAVISGTMGSNGWYTSDVTLTAPEGYQISKTKYNDGFVSKLTFSAEQNETITYYLKDANGDVAEKTATLKIDKTAPSAKYQIGTDGWKQFINTITFGLFCKDYKTVDIEYTDELSGVAEKQYYISREEITNTSRIAWLDYTDTLSLNATGKYFIYMRVVDNAGNEVILNTEGIVIYADSEAETDSVTAVYKNGFPKEVSVNLNGNTIKSVANGTTILTENTDYVLLSEETIRLSPTYLDTLNAGEYTFTVSYNPQGVETDKVNMTTTFTVTVEKADGKVSNLSISSKTYDGNAVTAPTFDKLGDGTATIEYKKQGADDRTYTTTAPSAAGDYVVRVTVAASRNYKEASATAEFSISKATLTNVTVQQNSKLTYDGGNPLNPSVSANATAVNKQPVTFAYSTEQNGTYGSMPTFDKAGSYTVYYKATAPNHNEVTGSFTVTVDKDTVTEPTIASKTYTGEAQTADVPASNLYTVEKNNGGTAKGSYDVVLKLKDADNYKWATDTTGESATVTLQFVISAAENSWTTAPSINGWTYGQSANEPVFAAKYGAVKVTYTGKANDGSDYSSANAPTKAGSYTATFTVDGTQDYSGLSEQVNFTIAKATYDMTGAKWDYTAAFDYDGKEKAVTVIGLPSGVTVSGYEGNKATVVGNYTAKVTFTYDSNNYNTPVLSDLAWSIKNDWTPTEYVVSTPNANGWLNDEFTIIPAEGYVISTTNTADGVWEDKLTYTAESDNGSVTFYLKNTTNGIISLGKTVTYKIDKTPATGKVEFVDRTGWEEFLNTISFGLFYKDEVTVKITANDTLSGIANIEYYEADEVLTLNEVKAIKNWTTYNDSFGVSVEDTKKFVYFVRITDNAGNVTYLSTDGAEYDTTAPVISGIENGKTYYTTQKVTVTEKNVASITLNGEDAGNDITLDGNKNATYTIVVTDKAGNSTTVTVTMKPISDLSAPIDTLNKDNVNSSDESVVDGVKAVVAAVDTANATEQEKAALKEITDKATELEKVIDDTKAEIARINEVLNKHNADTVNSDDAAALEQLGKDIKALTDGGNLTDAERTALTEDADDVAAMQKTVADTKAENDRISDAVDGYDLATVTSDDKADLEQLLADINKQLQSTNLTDEEISELNGEKKAVEDLLTKIKGTDELIDKLSEDMDGYSEETVKSTDKDAIEQIIEDIDALLETENLTDAEEKALEDAKTKAEGLLDAIEDAAEATTSENTEKVKDVTAENVTPENKTDLEKAKEDLEKALEDNGGNYTDDEKKAIEDEIKRIDDALEVIENVEEVEELIGKLPENITKNDEDAIKAADDAYNALTDYEKSLVDADAKKALDDAKAALAELNKPTDTNSPQTGDNSHLMLWIALLFISGGAVITLTVVDRKRRMASK